MARLRSTYIKANDGEPGNLYEMFPDHPALVGKEYHTEFSIIEVSKAKDSFTNGLHWENSDGVIRVRSKNNWSYFEELEHRLNILEQNKVNRPTIGKHITWWNQFTEKISNGHKSYADRVHSAVAANSDRNIILYRQDIIAIAASMSILNLSYAESGKRRHRIQTHGNVLITDDDPAIAVHAARLDRYLERLIASFTYLDPNKTIMIATEELDQLSTIIWPDGKSMILSDEGKQNFRSSYIKRDVNGNVKRINHAIQAVKNSEDVYKWAELAEKKFNWSKIRLESGFSKGF
jgi:hypothetical protein